MKKALTRVMLLAVTVVSIAIVMPISASASTSNNQKEIYEILTEEIGFNSAAACGIMANIERESDFNPRLVIRDSNGLTSGGLCQWNGSRFRNLKNFCYDEGYSYLSIEGQLRYLEYELQKSSYYHIYKYLMNVSNDEDGAYDAGWYWCYYFEIPSNRSAKAKQRGSMAEHDYWPVFGETAPEKVRLSFMQKENKYDLAEDIAVEWSFGGAACDYYRIYVAQKQSNGKYDWAGSYRKSISHLNRSMEIPAFTFDPGTYAVLIRSWNSENGKYKDSNYIYMTVDCYSHDYNAKITEDPTLDETGLELLTCEKCGKQKTKVIPEVDPKDLTTEQTIKPSVYAASPTAIRIKWSPCDFATAYRVYIRENNKWTYLSTIDSDQELTYLYRDLKPATEYRFCIRAYVEHEGKVYYKLASPTLVTSTETYVPTVYKTADVKDAKRVYWKQVDGADGYQIYIAKGNGSYKRVATVSAKYYACDIKNLDELAGYRVVVRSYIKCSNGSYVYSNCSDAKMFIA